MRKVGFVASCFDLLHAGHCLFLKDGKKQCDYLIAALQTDPTIDRPSKNKPVLSLKERKILLESNKYIDEIIIYDTEKDLEKILKKIQPDVRILGNDYLNKPFTGSGTEKEVYYHDRKSHKFSTTDIRKRILKASHE